MSDLILVERNGQIATVILNRPDQRNAMSRAMWRELIDVAQELETDPQVRVVILRGAGTEAFSAGADISEFEQYRSNSALAREYSVSFEGALEAVAGLSKPTISLIQGFCVGGGLELAAATDLRIAGEEARFGVPIAQLGIVVGYKEMRRFVQLVGSGPVMNLLLTARIINAAEALRIGLVTEVTATGEVERTTYALAERMCKLAPLSARWHKKILKTVLEDPSLENLSTEQQALPFTCYDTADFREGRHAFLEKRRPRFEGK